jgi:hypothetical protein
MTTGVSETSIIAAALVAQVCIVVIMATVSALVALGYRGRGGFSYIVLLLALFTLIPLMLTRGYSSTWGPLLGAPDGAGLSRSTSMVIVFVANIAAVHLLVRLTGGSRESPFQALYFLLPTLALFLREPLAHVLGFLALVIASYSFLSGSASVGDYRNEVSVFRFAYWFGAVACFVLASYIGYVTRPL